MFELLEAGAGLDVVLWLQSMQHPALDTLAQTMDTLGGNFGYLILLPLVYWSINRRLGRWLLVVLVTALFVIIGGKELFGRPRPFVFAPEQVAAVVDASGFGFPSGHVGISLALWGFVALWAQRTWGYVLLAVYVALMAWARMYAGVHYPQDVVGGLVLGGVVAGGVYAMREPLRALWRRLPLWAEVLLLLVLGAGMALLLRGDESGVSGAGILIGGGWGLIMEYRLSPFQDSAKFWQRTGRFFLGMAATLGLFLGLDAAFATLTPETAWRVVRYAAVSFLILGLYPLVMVRTGLAVRENA